MHFYTVIDRPEDNDHVLYIRYENSIDVETHRIDREYPIAQEDIPRVAWERICILDAAYDGSGDDMRTSLGKLLVADKWVAYHIPREVFK